MRFLAYFFAPFPSQQGFSPYRMPGAAVHLPVIIMATVTGMMLCLPNPAFKPLLAIWIIAGLYLGRDFAILCHYAPILTLLTWAVFIAFIIYVPRAKGFGTAHPNFALGFSLAVLAVQILVIWRYAVAMRDNKDSSAASG